MSAVPHRDKATGRAVASPHGVTMGPDVEHIDGIQGSAPLAGLFRRESLRPIDSEPTIQGES